MGWLSEQWDNVTSSPGDQWDSAISGDSDFILDPAARGAVQVADEVDEDHRLTPFDNYEQDFASDDDDGKEGKASEVLGRIYREEWQDYMDNYAPYDQRMVDLATGDEDNEQAISRARESAGLAFDSAEGSYRRGLSRVGVSEDQDERQDRKNRSKRSRTASRLTAANQARLHTQDRDSALLGGNLAVGLRDMENPGGM